MTSENIRKETPWAIICDEHGKVYLTHHEYDTQMSNPDDLWKCPICYEDSQWDDDNYELYYETNFPGMDKG